MSCQPFRVLSEFVALSPTDSDESRTHSGTALGETDILHGSQVHTPRETKHRHHHTSFIYAGAARSLGILVSSYHVI